MPIPFVARPSSPAVRLTPAVSQKYTYQHLENIFEYSFRNQPDINKPGRLTDIFAEQDPAAFAPRDVALGVLESLQRKESIEQTVPGTRIERKMVEAATLARIDGNFNYAPYSVVELNGIYPTLQNRHQLANASVNTYFANRLIKTDDSVIDVGSGEGYTAAAIKANGVREVEALEPLWREKGGIVSFPQTREITSDQYIASHPGKRFSVVLAQNFSPRIANGQSALIKDLATLTSDNGKAIIGVSSANPEYVAGSGSSRLRPMLEKHFGKVEFLSAKKLGQEYSVGGQIGLFVASQPKR